MEFVRMGTTGTQVSPRLCLGAMSFGSMADWTLNEEDSFAIVRKAAEGGDQLLRYRRRLFAW